VRPNDFPIGSLESRAIARLIAQQQESERKQAWLAREKKVVAFPMFWLSSSESIKPCRSEWFESGGSKKLCCILWVPPDMSVEEAARIVFPEGV
jgi:hypothetical protein